MVKPEHRREYNKLQDEKKRKERFFILRFFDVENRKWQIATLVFILILLFIWFIMATQNGNRIKNVVLRPSITSVNSGLGYELFIDPKDKDINALLQHGHIKYTDEAKFIRKFLRKGDVALDIGPGFGYYAIMMAMDVGKDGLVYLFEPNPRTRSALRASIGYNDLDNCIVRSDLLFSQNIEVGLQLFEDHMERYRITSLPESDASKKVKNHYTVNAKTLDAVLPNLTYVKFIRINASGAELEIISGARKIVANSPELSILMHWDIDKLSEYSNVVSAIENLLDAGFEFWDISEYDRMRLITKDALYQYKGNILISRGNIS